MMQPTRKQQMHAHAQTNEFHHQVALPIADLTNLDGEELKSSMILIVPSRHTTHLRTLRVLEGAVNC